MLLGEYSHLSPGVIAEYPRLWLIGASVARGLGSGRVRHRVIIAQDLLDGAAAVPPIRRQVEFPELVRGRQRGVIEYRVIRADTLIADGSILEVA